MLSGSELCEICDPAIPMNELERPRLRVIGGIKKYMDEQPISQVAAGVIAASRKPTHPSVEAETDGGELVAQWLAARVRDKLNKAGDSAGLEALERAGDAPSAATWTRRLAESVDRQIAEDPVFRVEARTLVKVAGEASFVAGEGERVYRS